MAYLKAVLEANQLFREHPEAISSNIEKGSGIEKEVVYMFLGPSGIQKLDPRIQFDQLEALKNSVVTLKQIGKLDASVNPEDVVRWADESYLKQAMKETGVKYEDTATVADKYVINGNDALTKEAIANPKMAAQIWIEGENKVRNYASVNNLLSALQKLKTEGKTPSVIFVHDHNHGWKLFAQKSFYVHNGNEVSAFLLEKDAQAFAGKSGAKVADFNRLQNLVVLNK